MKLSQLSNSILYFLFKFTFSMILEQSSKIKTFKLKLIKVDEVF